MRQFLLFFVKPECLKPLKVETLLTLNLDDKSVHLALDAIFLGKAEEPLKNLSADVQRNFRQTALGGYIACGKVLLEKLPLNNAFLQAAGGLDPDKKCSEALVKCLKLPSFLPADVMAIQSQSDDDAEVSIEEQKEATQAAYSKEVRFFFGEDDIPALEEGQRVDEWWAKIIKQYSLNHLSRVVRAVLSIFHGPVVESSFNIMGDVIDERSGRMDMATFDAYHTTRYALAASGKNATALLHRDNVMRDPVNKRLITNISTARQSYHQVLTEKNEERKRKIALFDKQQARIASKRKALESLKNDATKAHLKHFRKQAR